MMTLWIKLMPVNAQCPNTFVQDCRVVNNTLGGPEFFISTTFFLQNPIVYNFSETFAAGICILSLSFEIIRIRNTAYDATLEKVITAATLCRDQHCFLYFLYKSFQYYSNFGLLFQLYL